LTGCARRSSLINVIATEVQRYPGSTPADAWDARLRDEGGHLLQSWRWGAFKQQHGWTPHRILVETPDGVAAAQVLYRSRGPVSIGYIPRGPLISGAPEPLWKALREEIDRAALQHRAIMTIIEPDSPLGLTGSFGDAGVVRGPAHFQPGRTVKVPLLDDEPLLKQMHQKTRYSVRLAQRRGVTIERRVPAEESIDQFYALMLDTSARNAFGIHSKEYYADFLRTFSEDAVLLFARVDANQIGAALIAAAFGSEAIYMYGASSSQNRAHGAAFLLQFEAMRWARERGCTIYDLWGIPAQDPTTIHSDDQSKIVGTKGDDLRGLYRFKTGFGGEIVSYPPSMERRHMPVLPWLARKLNVVQG
jgi:lipid II:glycine glycyltransferase (peptidoglycan interpeptide bridge formation enzyme)